MSIFFNFGGRINRQPFVILCFALLGMYTMFSVLFVGLLGGFTAFLSNLGLLGALPDIRSIDAGFKTVFIVSSATMILLIFVSSLSLCVRRLHDRDKSGWWLLVYYLVCIILIPLGVYTANIGFVTVSFIILAVLCAVSLWFLIDLCLRRGTNGPNLYGSDPINGSVADAAIFG